MKILGIIPARGGSKGIPRKNLRNFAGRPLIARTIEEALKVSAIDRLICSTDDSKIASVARSYGCEVPFMRPKALAGNSVPAIDVLLHALDRLEKEGDVFDAVIYLQCTSPLRMSGHITGAIKRYMDSGAKSLVSVCESEHTPFWTYTIDGGRRLRRIIKGQYASVCRQDLPKAYRSNGAIYINDVKTIRRTRDFYKPAPMPFLMDRLHSIDIDSEVDLDIAELFLTMMKDRKMKRSMR